MEYTDRNIEVVDPVLKCCSSYCHAAAAFIVYWPGQTKNMCAKCCGRATQIGTAMGFDLQSRPIPPRTIAIASLKSSTGGR